MRKLNPITHVRAIHDIISLLTSHRQLTWEMTKKELTDKYAGQIFGTFWVIAHPLFMMAVYVTLFGFLLNRRAGALGIGLPFDYISYLLVGLIPWMCAQEVMTKSVTVIVNEKDLVKQIVFPTEVLPVKCVLASLPSQFIGTVILFLYVFLKHGYLHVTYLLLPLLILTQTFAMIGVAYILSSMGVFLRDMKDFVQLFTFAGVFVTPIFFIPGGVDSNFEKIFFLNPFSYMIWCYQDVCYFGHVAHPLAWILFPLMSFGIFYIGYGIFYKLKNLFGNVL
jgi:lipopolysaccharide transport system permease protein